MSVVAQIGGLREQQPPADNNTITMGVLKLSFPEHSSGLEQLMSEVRQQRRKQKVQAMELHLNWSNLDPPGNRPVRRRGRDPEMVPRVVGALDQLAATAHLEKVSLHISRAPKQRMDTHSAQPITALLDKFHLKVHELHLEGAILEGDFESLLNAIRSQVHMEKLHWEGISPLPEHAHRQLPKLFLAAASLPKLRFFFLSGTLPPSISDENDLGDALVQLSQRPNLTRLELLRSIRGQGPRTCLLQALHCPGNRLQHLTLDNDHDRGASFLQAVGEMLQANHFLKTLFLRPGADVFKSMTPLWTALQTNRSLRGLTFLFPKTIQRLQVPNDVGVQVLQKDNTTLHWLRIYEGSEDFERKLSSKTDFYLKLNRLGRRHFIQNPNESTLVQTIAEQDVDVIYYYLRQAPGLWVCNPNRKGCSKTIVAGSGSFEPVRKRRKVGCLKGRKK